MSVPDRDVDKNGLRPELYLSISSLFSGETPSLLTCEKALIAKTWLRTYNGGHHEHYLSNERI